MDGVMIHTTSEIRALLGRLHSENSKQESSLQRKWYKFTVLVYCLWKWKSREEWDRYNDLSVPLFLHSAESADVCQEGLATHLTSGIAQTSSCPMPEKNAS